MQTRLHVNFYYDNGKQRELIVAIPKDVAEQIQANKLTAVKVTMEAKLSSITNPVSKPEFDDLKGS